MPNPSIVIAPNDRIAPPFAQPAQPGEIRTCANCIRLVEMLHRPGNLYAECEWRGEWFRPHAGCDRWALDPLPRASLIPGLEPKPIVWVGKGSGTKRRRR